MADDVQITAGSGTTIATEDVAGVHHQKVKVEFGADGAATLVTNADPLPIIITGTAGEEALVSEGGALSTTVDNAVVVKGAFIHDIAGDPASIAPVPIGGRASAAAPTSVSTDDDAVLAWYLRNGAAAVVNTAGGELIGGDAANGLDVDVTRSALPTGASTSANQTTIIGHLDGVEGLLGTIDADTGGILTAVQTLDNAIAGTEMQVDVVAALPAGDNNIGNVDIVTLPALVAGTANIGDVDVLTVPADPFGANADAVVAAGATGSIQAKLRRLTTDLGTLVGVIKNEDAASGSGDAGIPALAVRSDTPAPTGANGDYVLPVMGASGGVWKSEVADPAGGCSVFKSLDLDETEEEVKATAGSVYGWYVFNNRSTKVYLKFYNATAANVTVGTTVPVMTFPIPAGETVGVAANMAFAPGILFGTAITVAATTGLADNDTGTPAANDCIVNIFYK